MYPKLFSIGPLSFYSFGAMMALAFLTANSLLVAEIKRRRITPDVSTQVTVLAMVLGLAGAKLFHILENIPDFARDPFGLLFSGGGLTFYGGLIVAAIGICLYLRSKQITVLEFCDAAAPALMIAYGIGRIGCLLAGDGDYGQPWISPFAMTYPNGIVSTLALKNPELVAKFRELYPTLAVPTDIPVHPAPIYETLYSFVIFGILWRLRTRLTPNGWLFSVYLMMQAACRFIVEFIRINNELVFGLSQAQVVSIVLFSAGLYGVIKLKDTPIPDKKLNPQSESKTAVRAKGTKLKTT
jgi:phosphatidylglycerol:prolipoprotein diacylglycerol transferase